VARDRGKWVVSSVIPVRRAGASTEDRGIIYLKPGGYDVRMIHTNTVEGYYSIFKRGMKRIYQHCSEKHLHRYLAEFDFRYSHRVKLGYGDDARTAAALKGIVGKRLTCRATDRAVHV
jgi:hypothetical protein